MERPATPVCDELSEELYRHGRRAKLITCNPQAWNALQDEDDRLHRLAITARGFHFIGIPVEMDATQLARFTLHTG